MQLREFFGFIVSLPLILLVMTISSLTYAERSVDLYTANALVVNQTEQVRRQAAIRGLETVIVRLSGSRDTLQHPRVSEAVSNASAYLYQFSYQSTDQTIKIAGASQPATRLVMRFSQAPLETLLQDAQLPIWSSSRPDVLVWTASNAKGQNYVTPRSNIGSALKIAAANRGLPVVSPVLDLEDRSALSVSRLWALDEGSVRVAARRYDADAVLAGRFSKARSNWNGNFILLHQGKTQYFSATGDRQSKVANDIIDRVTEYFANIYAAVPGSVNGSNSMLLQVNNINEFSRYTEVLNYLEKINLVESLMLENVQPDQLQVRVNLNTDRQRFLTTLELDKKLRRVNQEEAFPSSGLSVSLSQNENNGIVEPVLTTATQERPVQFTWQ
ncbi:MAG: DUF2066 domain-containing protein [Cellvibrionaceae bacterium]